MLARTRRGLFGAGALGAVALSVFACSVIVETRSQQCSTNADCSSFPSAACDLDTHTCADKREVACKAEGCVCDPKTSTEILNACTTAERHCFDNAKHGADGAPPPPPTTDPGAGGGLTASACPSGGVGGGAGGLGGAGGIGGASSSSTSTSGAGGGGGGMNTGGGGPDVQFCEELPNPVYTIGPDSIKPLLGWVAKFYAKKHVSVVYQSQSSCVAVDKAYGGTANTDGAHQYMESGSSQFTVYFDSKGNTSPCLFKDPKVVPNIALSDVFPQSCDPPYDVNHTDMSVNDTFGPVQAFGFVVPKASTQESISFEAAYLTYGFGDKSGVTPWDERKYIYERDPSSGTQSMVGSLLNIKPSLMRATQTHSSNDEALLVACSKEPEKTIGILAADLVQEHVADIKLLAYQHAGQSCGYLPDSTADSNDKANVRDGHYFIWGPIHMLTQAGESNSDALDLIKYVGGTIPAPEESGDLFQHWVDAHLVPQCAMRVTRTEDAGDLTHEVPPNPCACRYEEVATGHTTCKTCTTSSTDCPICSNGFCEPQ